MSRLKLMSGLIVFILGLNIFFINQVVFAQTLLPEGSIFISEINWDGSWAYDNQTKTYKSNSSDEWLELHNNSENIINLLDIKIKGAASSGKDLVFKDPSKCVIYPKQYLVISRLEQSESLSSLSRCVATNMSLSNSSLNIIITDKTETTKEVQYSGNPSSLVSDKNTGDKYSISKKSNSWVTSQSKKDIIGLNNTNNLPYHHFSSPGSDDLQGEIDISLQVETKEYPTIIKPDITLFNQKIVKISNRYAVGPSDCNFYPSEYLVAINIIKDGDYCIKTKSELSDDYIQFVAYLEKTISVKNTTPTPPKQGISGIKINEIDLNNEKIEILNTNNYQISLNNFIIEDLVGSTKKIKLSDILLKPGVYSVIDMKSLGISLNNDGDNIRLYDSDGVLIDQTNILDLNKTLTSGSSFQYFKDRDVWEVGLSTIGGINKRTPISAETKESEQVSMEKSYFLDKIRINEVYPQGDEFVEMYNFSNQDVNLSGLVIIDLKGSVNRIVIKDNTIIKSKDFYVVNLKSKISLNNDGDGLVFLTTQGDIVQKVEYDFSREKDLSYQYFDEGWFWSQISPGSLNTKSQNNNINENDVFGGDNKACENIEIYIQTSKNIFISNKGKISLSGHTEHDLPYIANICDVKPKNDYIQGVFNSWVEDYKYVPKNFADNTQNIENNTIVNFTLSCKGKKIADIIRDDVVFRAAYLVEKPQCVNNNINGLGLIIKTEDGYWLYYISKSNSTPQHLNDTKTIKNNKTDTDADRFKTSTHTTIEAKQNMKAPELTSEQIKFIRYIVILNVLIIATVRI